MKQLSFFCWIIALAAGLMVLAGYFVPVLVEIQQILLQVAMFVAAFGVLAGVINLLVVHVRRFDGEQKGGGYSVAVILAFLIPLVTAVLDGFVFDEKKPFGIFSQWVFTNMLLPVEATLFALVAVALAYFAARMLRWRTSAFGLVFFCVILITLVLTSPVLALLPSEMRSIYGNFLQPLVLGGGRGILLGVALGTIATGIRILMGADRPYG